MLGERQDTRESVPRPRKHLRPDELGFRVCRNSCLSVISAMVGGTAQLGLRPAALPIRNVRIIFSCSLKPSHSLARLSIRRSLSSRALRATPQLALKTGGRLPSHLPPRQSNSPTSTPSSFFTPSLCRHASTASPIASEPSHTATASTATSAPTQPSPSNLDWNTFFKLRKSRRRYSLSTSVLTSFVAFAGCGFSISVSPAVADVVAKTIPTDPFISMGIATFAATLFGWLIGPFFGNAIWRALHRSKVVEFMKKERGFFERIKKHRVDPRGASANNPVPDYYGEKVASVEGYRRWLKDQRAFNRKRGGTFVL
jgi:import inner membrane translocase subunit TIM23